MSTLVQFLPPRKIPFHSFDKNSVKTVWGACVDVSRATHYAIDGSLSHDLVVMVSYTAFTCPFAIPYTITLVFTRALLILHLLPFHCILITIPHLWY